MISSRLRNEVFHEKEEIDDFPLRTRFSSTPLKNRKSVSLLDISALDKEFPSNQKLTVSNDTIGSSGFQDSGISGFNQIASTSSLNSSIKDQERKISDLEDELKFKEILINELQESNHALRLRFADAQNKISQLRLQCESHCRCCTTAASTPTSEGSRSDEDSRSSHPIDRRLSDSSGVFQPKNFIVRPINKQLFGVNRLKTADEAYDKVKRWQDELTTASRASEQIIPKPFLATPKRNSRFTFADPAACPLDSPSSNNSYSFQTGSSPPFNLSYKRPESRTIKEDKLNEHFQPLHNRSVAKQPHMSQTSEAWTCGSAESEDDRLAMDFDNSSVEERWLEEQRKLKLEENEQAVLFTRKPMEGPTVGTVQFKNRKVEMEQRIRSGMNNIAAYPKTDAESIINEPFDCWKDSLISSSFRYSNGYPIGKKRNVLLDLIREASDYTLKTQSTLARHSALHAK